MRDLSGKHARAIDGLWAELHRARELHGETPFHGIHEGYAVLLEEVDELWDEVKVNPKRYIDISEDSTGRAEHRRRMYKEAIQVAAMAIRFAAEVC